MKADDHLKIALFGHNGAAKTKVKDIRLEAYRMLRPKPGSFQVAVSVTGTGSRSPTPARAPNPGTGPGRNPGPNPAQRTNSSTSAASGPASKSTQTLAHGKYITRDYELGAETEDRELAKGSEVREYLLDREKNFHPQKLDGTRALRQRDTLHLVFAAPDFVKPEDVKSATRATLKELFPDRRYLFVLHEKETDPKANPSKYPHVHADVEFVDKQGNNRIQARKADLYNYREVYAEKLRELGYEAEATPRMARGLERKWHLPRGMKQMQAKGIPLTRQAPQKEKPKELLELIEKARELRESESIAHFNKAAQLLAKELDPKARELSRVIKEHTKAKEKPKELQRLIEVAKGFKEKGTELEK